MERLSIAKQSRPQVIKVLNDCNIAVKNNIAYNPTVGYENNGADALIKDLDESAHLIYETVSNGMSYPQITALLNIKRCHDNLPIFGVSAVQRFVCNSACIDVSIRQTLKSGKSDPASDWATARLAECEMIKEMIYLGTLPRDSYEVRNSLLRPIYRGGIVFFDEKHTKCKLGPSSKFERRVSRNEHGEVCEPAMNGRFPEHIFMRSTKFTQEGRGCFGTATRVNPDDSLEGIKLPIFDYTGKEVVSMGKWDKMFELEKAEKIVEGNKPTPTGKQSIWFGGYEGRYGARWQEECEKAASRNYCCVTELVEYMVREAKALYVGTDMADSFVIYHDHLKVMWEKRCIDWMKQKDYWKHFIKITGPYNDRVHARYKNCLVGDSPEMARGLDSYGFADLMVSISFHVAVTYKLGRDNNLKFQLGTPRDVMRCMVRCWEVEPTAARVLEDIESWEFALDKIIAVRGCVVHGLALRHGHRLQRIDGKGHCTARVQNRQRKDTLIARPVHADALGSFNLLTGLEDRIEIARIVQDAQQNEQDVALATENDIDIEEDDNDDNNEDD